MKFTDIFDTAPSEIKEKFIQLYAMRERPDYHPEESAGRHIEIVVERAIQFGDKDLIMAAFYHDIHKHDTMKINEKTGWPTSPGHDKWSHNTIRDNVLVQSHISEFGADIDTVRVICGEHMRYHQLDKMKESKQLEMKSLFCFNKLRAFGIMDNMLISDEECIQQIKDLK